jgi:hypothetical protein
MPEQQEREPRSVSPEFSELLASCAAADAVSRPPEAPSRPVRERREAAAVAGAKPERKERGAA